MSLIEILEQVQAMPVHERKQLIKSVIDMLPEAETQENGTPSPRRSLLDFEGLGAYAYTGEDAQAYLRRVRDEEWDHRP
ncbi:MAG: hypothetical protein SGJ24_10680 [Chloroflexota bacterium]|nr:hypothetical protein [Chloroflexota bacterium]